MSAIFIIGIFLAFFLMILLFSKKQKSVPDKILAVWMLFIGLHLLSFFLYSLGYWDKYPHLVGIHHPFPLIYGPLLFLYTLYSLRSDQRFRKKDLLHFLPFLFSYIYMSPFLFTYTAEQKRISDQMESDPGFHIYFMVSLIALIVSGILYPILSYRLIARYRRLIDENFAYKEGINLNWLQMFITGIFSVYFVVAVFSALKWGFSVNFGFDPSYIFFSLIVLFVFFLGYFGIRQQDVFANPAVTKEIALPKAKTEYQNSGLKEEDARILHNKLKRLMLEEKPYLEPKLSLGNLAQQLSVSVNYLSQAINQCEGKNFHDFVNEFRVNEFIQAAKLPENKNYNILGLAFDAGFNSKSSFNQIFKKQTGKTPSEFIRENL